MKYPALCLSAAILFISCNSTPAPGTQTGQDSVKMQVVTPAVKNADPQQMSRIQALFKSYLNIQKALADDNPGNAARAAQQLALLIDSTTGNSLTGAQKQVYEYRLSTIRIQALRISNTNRTDQQRIAFASLSEHLLGIVSSFGNEEPVYEIHCSMALNNKGASWLSDKATVRNPYFGNKMLECGDIVKVIKKPTQEISAPGQ